ncbi:MAG: glycoside hydrolase family 2 protein [Verrucomicrobiota bacterium]
MGKSNLVTSTIHDVHLHTVFDGPRDEAGELRWSLHHLDRRVLRRGSKKVALRYGQSVRQLSLDFAKDLAQHGVRSLVLRVELAVRGRVVSRQTVFFTAPRNLELKPARIEATLRKAGPARFELTLASRDFQHAAAFHFRGIGYGAEDNFFDLYPGTPRRVIVKTARDLPLAQLRQRLETVSLVDSYHSR